MIYAVLAASAIAFAPPASLHQASAVRCSAPVTMMAEAPVSRRQALFSVAAAAAAVPLAANADGASSRAVIERARALYGSRIFRLQGASAEKVVEEKNVFDLFITGSYRSAADKSTVKELRSLQKTILKAAAAGDKAGAAAGIKSFIAVGEIRELDVVPGGNFDPKQRRNAGAPATSEIEAQMGPSAYALYKPLK